jgi:hypothetical protein
MRWGFLGQFSSNRNVLWCYLAPSTPPLINADVNDNVIMGDNNFVNLDQDGVMSKPPVLRFVRPVSEPLGLFLRPGHNDHRVLSQLLSEGRSSITGVVFEPTSINAQDELRSEVNRRNLWAILDTRLMEMATPRGFTDKRSHLPWGGRAPHRPQDLSGAAGQSTAAAIVQFVGKYGFNAILVGHYLEHGAQDVWFRVDLALLRELRRQLDAQGLEDVAIYYTLAVPTSVFNESGKRAEFKAALQTADIDGLWLCIHPFGASSGHITLQRYITSCQDLHSLRLPLVAEKVGSIGLPLLAFGAVSGIESGISSGDKFDFARLNRPLNDKAKNFAAHARVYLPGLGVFLDREAATTFFANRNLKAGFSCQNTACCRRGTVDTLGDPRRHFVFTRMEEVGTISQVPPQLRPSQYLDNVLRPATDRLGRVLQSALNDDIKGRLERERRKLDGWRHTLGEMSRSEARTTWATTPVRRIARRRGA